MESDKEQFLPLAVLFCVYINNVIKLLRCSTIECQIQGLYADDIILLSPSRTGLQEMVKICENFAKAITKLEFS